MHDSTQIDQRSIYTEILNVLLRATTFDDPELAQAALERFTDYEVSYGRHDEGRSWRGKDLITDMTQKDRLHAVSRSSMGVDLSCRLSINIFLWF